MRDNPDADAPPPPGLTKVEITVGGHTVAIEADAPLADIVGYAMGIWEQTTDAGKKIPFGFDNTGGQFERAEPYVEPGHSQQWEDDHGGRMDRVPAQDGTTRRLVLPNPPSDHRPGLRQVPVDRGRAQVPRTRH